MIKPGTINGLSTQIQYRLIEKLMNSERCYRERIENLSEIFFECDRTGQLTFVNRAWVDTLGHQVSETIGQSMATFIDKCDKERWEYALKRHTDYPTEKPSSALELRFPHKTGDTLWLELTIQFSQANILSGSLTNITERKQAKAILQRTNEELESRVAQRTAELSQANKALKTTLKKLRATQGQLIQTEKMSSLGQLVAGIAHEINNPVSFVCGNLEPAYEYTQDILGLLGLYQQHYPNPSPQISEALNEVEIEFIQTDFPKLLNSMKIGTQRIQSIVDSLRNFSRLDEADCKTADIHEGLENTLLILNSRLKANPPHQPIELIKNYGELPLVECFPSQLNQVFMNLLANAIDALRSKHDDQHYSHPNPTITLQTEAVDDSVVVTIEDNGTSIPVDVMSRLFDPFFTTKSVGKGTGLGLSISHQIITEKHGGTLRCHSTANEGTTFIVQIPISSRLQNSVEIQ